MFLFCKNRNDVVEADDLIIKEEKFISAATREHCAKTKDISNVTMPKGEIVLVFPVRMIDTLLYKIFHVF